MEIPVTAPALDILYVADALPTADADLAYLTAEVDWIDRMHARQTASFGSPYNYTNPDSVGLYDPRPDDDQLAIEGEMRGDAALSKTILDHEFPDSGLTTEANVLVMPNVDAANISYNLLRIAAGNGITVGGILLGAARPVHILTPSATVRRLVNMTALAVVDAGSQRLSAVAID